MTQNLQIKDGQEIKCLSCNGYGMVNTYPNNEVGECKTCKGRGTFWLYNSGVLAEYYSGPLAGNLKDYLTGSK